MPSEGPAALYLDRLPCGCYIAATGTRSHSTHLYQVLAGRVADGRRQRYPRPEWAAIGEILEWAANPKGTGFGFPRAGQGKAAITAEGRKAISLKHREWLSADRLKGELIFARGDTSGHGYMECIRRFAEGRASDGP